MSAASELVGLTLPQGWKVTRQLQRPDTGTGGLFSQSYEVVRGKDKGFLKAFDFSEAFEDGADTVAILDMLLSGYKHEKSILEHCADKRLSRVVLAVDHGQVTVPGYGSDKSKANVFYLIFERAECDIRCQMDTMKRFDAQWSMRALKDISLGLHQLHREMIAHQDTKPSNVLVYPNKIFKIADFGRSSRRGQPAYHDNYKVPGDRTYSAPELLYGHLHPDFTHRRMGSDFYMLGNLASFLFTGRNITGMLLSHLDKSHHPAVWTGTYDQVLPYLLSAFTKVLEEISAEVDEVVRDDVVRLIRELSNPDLARRGHPRGLGKHDQFSLERYVSHLDRVSQKLDVALRVRTA